MSEKKPRLFYWEDAVDSFIPAPETIDEILSAESHFHKDGEEFEIRFKRFDLTDEELEALPVL